MTFSNETIEAVARRVNKYLRWPYSEAKVIAEEALAALVESREWKGVICDAERYRYIQRYSRRER